MKKSFVWGFPVLLFIGFAAIISLPMEKSLPPVKAGEQRIIVPDWSSVETLITLHGPLVGVAEKSSYNMWVVSPHIPDTIVDMGLRGQPNIELVNALRPTLMINSTFLQGFLPPIFSSIPTKEINFSTSKGGSWDQILLSTHELGQVIGHPERADQLVLQTEQLLANQQQQLASLKDRPMIIVQFIDARSVRIFGANSLYGIVLNKLGLKNAWTQSTESWGFSTIPLTDLINLPKNTMMIIVKPNPVTVRRQLSHSAIWQHLPVSLPENHRAIPSTWLFGGLPAIQHFSTNVTDALLYDKQVNW